MPTLRQLTHWNYVIRVLEAPPCECLSRQLQLLLKQVKKEKTSVKKKSYKKKQIEMVEMKKT